MNSERQNVLNRARRDYRPDLVAVDEERILSLYSDLHTTAPMVIHIHGAPGQSPEAALPFLVAMMSLNYRFWTRQPDGTLSRYTHYGTTGARALWLAFERAWGGSTGEFAQRIRDGQFRVRFGDMPDSASREAILAEVLEGTRLTEVCNELLADIQAEDRVTVHHAARLAEAFPRAFADPYLKKAQLTVAAFAAYLRSVGGIVDASDLTAMADYQVPRVLRAIEILTYGAQLSALVDGGELLPPESAEENAIRAATILACEALAVRLGGTPADVDNMLWQSQDVAGVTRFHLTETTQY